MKLFKPIFFALATASALGLGTIAVNKPDPATCKTHGPHKIPSFGLPVSGFSTGEYPNSLQKKFTLKGRKKQNKNVGDAKEDNKERKSFFADSFPAAGMNDEIEFREGLIIANNPNLPLPDNAKKIHVVDSVPSFIEQNSPCGNAVTEHINTMMYLDLLLN